MLAASLVILMGVVGLFLCAFKQQRRPRVPARLLLWGGGLVLPAVTLAGLLVYALGFGQLLLPRAGEDAARIEVVARQWRWEFRHLDGQGVTRLAINELHLPAGRPVELLVTSADVIHGFWLPRLGGKIDAVPGQVNRLRLDPAEPGSHAGVCAEFCGLAHARMGFRAIVHPPSAYDAALAGLAASPPPEAGR